jgi:hypothetical protein
VSDVKSSDLTQILARDIDDRHELYALRRTGAGEARRLSRSHDRSAGQPIHVIKFADGHTPV